MTAQRPIMSNVNEPAPEDSRSPEHATDAAPARETSPFETLVEDYLIALGEGRAVDRASFAAQLPRAEERRQFHIVVISEATLERQRSGEFVNLDQALSELDETDRGEARVYIERSLAAESSRPQPLPEGTLLAGRFRILRQLASGGTAMVYVVHDEHFDVERVLKAINRERATTVSASNWEELALGEARLLARLESRNIVTVYDIVRDGPQSYIVMEYLRGRSLHEVVHSVASRAHTSDGGPQRRPQADWIHAAIGEAPRHDHRNIIDTSDWYRCTSRILRHAIHALELAHGEGICHRDIKPANILLVGGGEPVLLDFGFGSAVTAGEAGDRKLVGTPEYMAPEQFRAGYSGSDPRTDLYQVGVVLYELVTLRCPYSRASGDLLAKKKAGTYTSPDSVDPQIPAALAAIITKAMCPELNERYQSAREMCIDLERFEAAKPPLFAPLPPTQRAAMWAGWAVRRPAFMVGMIGAIALALVFHLRGETWFPPALAPMHSMDGGAATASRPSQVLDWTGGSVDIGLNIDASTPSVLYAFELYGELGGTRYIRPLAWEGGQFALEVDESASTPVLTISDEAAWPVEEVYVLATESPNAALEQYIDELAQDTALGVRVPFQENRIESILSGTTRGTSLAELTAERRAALKRTFARSAQLTDADYAEAGVKPYRFGYRILKRE